MSAQPDEKNRTPLGAEDRARMARLYEEIEGRLHEMALIVARTLSLDTTEIEVTSLGRPLGETRNRGAGETPDRVIRFKGIEIVCTPAGCGCYDHDAGECFPC